MRTLHSTALFALVLLSNRVGGPDASDEVALRFAPGDDASVLRTFDSEAEYELVEVELLVDGESPGAEMPDPDLVITATEHIVVRDALGTITDGRPVRVKRHFEELAWTTSFSADSQPEDIEQEETRDLADTTVVFTWDADDEDYSVEFDEDSDGDSALLEHLDEDMDLRAFLPAEEVEVDDTWELPLDAYVALVWPGGVLSTHQEDQEADPRSLAMSIALLENLEGDGEAELAEVTEEDGRELAHIHFTLSISAEAEVEANEETTLRRALEREIEGVIRWDVAAGHAVALEGQAETEMTMTTSGTIVDPEGNDHELEQTQRFEGSVTYEATYEYE